MSKYMSSESSDESGLDSVTNSPKLVSNDLTNLNLLSKPYTEEDLASIMVLPPEIIKLIFTFFKERSDLVKLLPVCKYWARILVELIWFRPRLQNETAYKEIQKILDKDPATTFFNYREFIRRLNVCFISSYVEDSFLEKFQNCSNLERLTLVNCSKLSSKSISKVLQNCSKLQSIDMSGVKDISDEIFESLAENCPRLQGVYAPDAGNVSNEAIIKLFVKCPYLKRIKLTKSDNVDDNAILQLAKNFKYVVEIDLHGCPNVTDESLTKVFNNLEQLREFRISQNRNISDAIFRSLPEGQFLTRLRIIDFTDCVYITDRSIEKIVQCAPRLRNVVLSKCISITDTSLKALSLLNKSLHYIHLGHCSNITDYGVKILVESCYRLQYIDLACCTQLTDNSVIELANLPRLKRIGLVKCVHITDQGIIRLIQKRGLGDTLERVHLSYCTQLSTHPIFLLLKSCPKLTHLSLTGIQAFLRPDFRRFCRTAPDEFTAHQRSLFCVFSGNGVKKLRDYLSTMYSTNAQMGSNVMRNGMIQITNDDINQQIQQRIWSQNLVDGETVDNHDFQRIWENTNTNNNINNNNNNNNNNNDNDETINRRFRGPFNWNNAYIQTTTPIPESLLFQQAPFVPGQEFREEPAVAEEDEDVSMLEEA